jgi:hypothetical protein
MEPTIYGMELDPGVHIDDAVPDCCYGPMDPKPAHIQGHLEYVCGDCGTVVEVDGLGLVHDIREKSAV